MTNQRASFVLVSLTSVFTLGAGGAAFAKETPPLPIVTTDGPPAAAAPAAAMPATKLPANPLQPVFTSFSVYTDRKPRYTHYVPSGYMGDNDLTMAGAYTATPDGQGPCLRVYYRAAGAMGWSGIYWQDPANNWGDVPGRAGFDLRGAERLTFWARGENGGERIHEFKIGGIASGRYPDSDVASITNVKLTREWKKYTIDLAKKDLRHIIGGFEFTVNKAENPGGMSFFLDDIIYEGPQNIAPVATTPAPAAPVGQAPPPDLSVPKELTPPPLPASAEDLTVKQVEEGLRVSFSSQLHFTPGKAVLEEGSGKVLDQLIALLNAYPANNVLIEGHTDSTGDPHYNLELSRLRATAVQDYLIKKGGYDAARFKVVGYGDTRPVADNKTKAGRSLNRRVEATILKSIQ